MSSSISLGPLMEIKTWLALSNGDGSQAGSGGAFRRDKIHGRVHDHTNEEDREKTACSCCGCRRGTAGGSKDEFQDWKLGHVIIMDLSTGDR